ncbi:MAG: sugar transferase, partial [Tepidimonas sp.]|uniref:sugar transferase n=1 Tax=Tepidimonas sp. TaxID=2002775 RepID=UPI004054F8AF
DGRGRVLVVGAGSLGRRAAAEVRKHTWTGLSLLGFVDDDVALHGRWVDELLVLGGLHDAAALAGALKAEHALVALPLRAHEKLVTVCAALQAAGVRVHVIPDLFSLSFPCAALDGFGGIPVITLGQPGLSPWQRAVKRALDGLLAGAVLLLAAPLLAAIALAIKLDSRGPVLYRQRRIGEGGRPFTMFKFRSMRAHCDTSTHRAHVARLIRENTAPQGGNGSGSLKLQADARVTRVGRILRRLSLDELPQLLNVLRGEMSLVGPRPPLPYEVELYQEWHRRRLQATPGMTGLWQVQGRNRVSFDEMVRMDLEYIQRQSLWLDLKILLKTPWAMVNGRGAG